MATSRSQAYALQIQPLLGDVQPTKTTAFWMDYSGTRILRVSYQPQTCVLTGESRTILRQEEDLRLRLLALYQSNARDLEPCATISTVSGTNLPTMCLNNLVHDSKSEASTRLAG